jgi:hypothetical protein
LAALTAPQPGSVKSAGAVCAAAACSSRSSSRIVRVRLRQRATSSDPYLRRLLETREAPSEPLEPDAAVERAEGDSERGIEIVQVPAQPLLCPPQFVDQVVAVIDQQLAQPPLLLELLVHLIGDRIPHAEDVGLG